MLETETLTESVKNRKKIYLKANLRVKKKERKRGNSPVRWQLFVLQTFHSEKVSETTRTVVKNKAPLKTYKRRLEEFNRAAETNRDTFHNI